MRHSHRWARRVKQYFGHQKAARKEGVVEAAPYFTSIVAEVALFLFIFTFIERIYILLIEYHSCCPHCFPLGRGPPLGCRAEIRTRACRTAS
jgi:hypothetical protein